MALVKSCVIVPHLPIAACSACGRVAGFTPGPWKLMPSSPSAEPAGARAGLAGRQPAGRPTAGVLTAVTGPLDAAAVHADRPAQQQIRMTRAGRAFISISSERAVVHACRSAASGLI